jgi:hypothetical protein
VIAGSGHTLSVIGELAGPLLKKDVDILAELIGHRPSEVLEVAHKATTAMNLATR